MSESVHEHGWHLRDRLGKAADIDSETKRAMIDDLYLQQIQFAKAAVEDIDGYRLARKGE